MVFKKGNKLGKQNKGRKRPDVSKRMKENKLWIKNIGRKQSEKTKKKISEHNKKRYANNEIFGFQRGDKNPMKDKKIRNKVSIKLKNGYKEGRIVWNKGKPHLVLEKHWNWKDGKSFEPYPISFNVKLKKLIRERDKYRCNICKNKGNIVHHIDYNKNNCSPENLITLCKSCHTKTNYDRIKWKKHFENEK